MREFKFSFKKAAFAQKKLRERLKILPLKSLPKLVGGCDLTFLNPYKTPTLGISSMVVMNPSMKVVEIKTASCRIRVPYVAGFLAFREVGLLVKAFLALKKKPDVLLVDGQGIAHPRGLGLASHLGVLLSVPTVGVAKKPLYGEYEEPDAEPMSSSPIFCPKTGQKIGYVLRTRKRSNPIFVSPGHLTDPDTALQVVKMCLRGFRLPEPTRLAHNVLKEERKKLL